MKVMKIALIFLVLTLAAPAIAQKRVLRFPVSDGDTFQVKLRGGSTYIVNPFPDVIVPDAEITSGVDCLRNGGYMLGFLEFFSMFQTGPNNCWITVQVIDDGDPHAPDSSEITFVRVKKVLHFDLTSSWQRLLLPKGTYAVWRNSPLMVAEVAPNSKGCREAHDGRHRLNIYGDVFTYTDTGNGLIEGANSEIRPGINSWVSWFRILPKRCYILARSILNGTGGTGQAGRLTLLMLASNDILPRG